MREKFARRMTGTIASWNRTPENDDEELSKMPNAVGVDFEEQTNLKGSASVPSLGRLLGLLALGQPERLR